MLKTSVEEGYLFIAAGVVGIIAIIVRLMLGIGYGWWVRASNSMEKDNSKSLEKLRTKFEMMYQLNIGVNNVDIFVEKHLNSQKLCGLYLSTWESISGQARILCATIAGATGIIGTYFECGQIVTLSTIALSVGCIALSLFVDNFCGLPAKKKRLKANVTNYFDNFMKVRLELNISESEVKNRELQSVKQVQNAEGLKDKKKLQNEIPNEELQMEEKNIVTNSLQKEYDKLEEDLKLEEQIDLSFSEVAGAEEDFELEEIKFEEEDFIEDDKKVKNSKKIGREEKKLLKKKRKEEEKLLKRKIQLEKKEVFAKIRAEKTKLKRNKKKSLTQQRELEEQEALAEMRRRREEKQAERRQRTLEEIRQRSQVASTLEEEVLFEKSATETEKEAKISNKYSKEDEDKILAEVLKEFLA